MNAGSPALYLARTPLRPLVLYFVNRVETEGLVDYQERAGLISIYFTIVNLFLTTNLVRISRFSSLFSAIAQCF